MKYNSRIIFELLRVKQWTKNLLIYAALVFTNNLFYPLYFFKVTLGFFLFSFAASSVYIFNDIHDLKEDKLHPDKKSRPLPSGLINITPAFFIAFVLLISSLFGAFFLNMNFLALLIFYILLNISYTFWLKHTVILDVFVIATGFVLRAVSGAFILNVTISPWLIICTLLLALFLALAKRRYELNNLQEATKHRKILEEYSVPLLDEMISVVTASTVIAYSFYTFSSKTAEQSHYLMLTIPFVLYGIFRYLYLIHKKNLGGSPELILLKDKPMIINILLYLLTTIIIIYFIK